MRSFFSRAIGFTSRKLAELHSTALDPTKIRRMVTLKRKGIHYSRYSLFNRRWLTDARIHTVLDVGANVGEFSAIFAELFPAAQIHAFEPLPDCYQKLCGEADKYGGRIKPINVGVGSQIGTLTFNRSNWAPASSFRTMAPIHKENYPHSADSESISVDVTTLDHWAQDKELKDNIMIKMDVQGFEDEVIRGGPGIVGRARVLVLECSFQPTYENEPMFDGIYELLKPMGFVYRGSLKQSIRKIDDSFLQADCLFVRDL